LTDATFVFADLAGFTALTEVHGDAVAADVAQTFCRELNRLLPPGGEDLKSLGDACMVRIPDAAEAVRFGVRLVREAGAGRPFPHVRVGMHTGPAVLRHHDWFGRTVNRAARISALAGPGEVLLSDQTLRAASGLDDVALVRLGPVALRNIDGLVVLHRAGDAGGLDPVDPVCRLRVPEGFCSSRCRDLFDVRTA
jgi:adenylate cyclase